VQVVINDYQMQQRMTHMTIFLSDCDNVKPIVVKRFSQYVLYLSLLSIAVEQLPFNCSNRFQILTDASGDHGHGLEK